MQRGHQLSLQPDDGFWGRPVACVPNGPDGALPIEAVQEDRKPADAKTLQNLSKLKRRPTSKKLSGKRSPKINFTVKIIIFRVSLNGNFKIQFQKKKFKILSF